MIFAKPKQKYLRRILLGILVFLTAMAQNASWLPVLYGARAFALIPLVAAIAFYDHPVAAVLYGALAGVLWDAMSPAGGFHGIYLALVAFLCAVCMRYFLNRNFVTIAILSLSTIALYLVVRWFITYAALPGLDAAQILYPLWRYALPDLGYTMLFTPLMFTLVHAIVQRTSKKQQKVLAE